MNMSFLKQAFVKGPGMHYALLVGSRDDRTQSARACLFFFFLHLDGLKTPIYTQTIVKWVARIQATK
jgi:hypothetical protein